MTDFERELETIMDEICEESANLIARDATEYYQERFTEKEWDDVAWQPAKNPPQRGSLMLRSSGLVNSIQPAEVTPQRVVIKAGYNLKVTYAQVHNEGFEGDVNVKSHTRKIRGKNKEIRAHTRHMRIPRRQYMGVTKELEDRIMSGIEGLIESKFNK